MSADRPNVLLVHCHDLGQHLGCYGADVNTPRLDALAQEGACFTNHFVTAPQCTPSRGSLMTGRHPHVNGLMGLAHGNWELHDDERVMPQLLNEAGYETHLFGLQHVTQDTDRLEYDHIHSEGNLYPGVSPAVHQINRASTVSSVVADCLHDDEFGDPFFASVGFFEAHRVEEDDGRFGFDADYYEPHDPAEVRPLSYLPDRRGVRTDLAELHGMVDAVDVAVGEILDALDDAGLAEETLVIFTTEHGIAFPRAKGSCYDAGIEAALLVRYPGLTEGVGRRDELLSNVDVLPTILDVAGVDVPDRVEGRSFRPLLAEANDVAEGGGAGSEGTGDGEAGSERAEADAVESYEPRDRIFAEMTWHDRYNPVRAIRTEHFKYVRSFWHLPSVYLSADVFASEAGREVREQFSALPRPYEELYDLRETPQEDDNIAFTPRYQDDRLRLSRELHDWMVATDDPLLDGPVVPADYGDVLTWPHQRTEE